MRVVQISKNARVYIEEYPTKQKYSLNLYTRQIKTINAGIKEYDDSYIFKYDLSLYGKSALQTLIEALIAVRDNIKEEVRDGQLG